MSYKTKRILAAVIISIECLMSMPQQISAAAAVSPGALEQIYIRKKAAGTGNQPVKAPAENPAKAPAEDPAKAPAENPAKAPAENPAKAPAENPAESAGKKTQGSILPAPETLEPAKVTYQAVTLSWSTVEGAVKYQIEYSTDGADYTVAGKTKSDVLTYKCRKLLTGTEYQFRVCALDQNGKCGNYISVKAQPFLRKSNITSISETQPQTVSLEWKKITGAASYELQRKTAGSSFAQIATTAALTYTDQNVHAGETYTYRVRAARVVNNRTVTGRWSARKEISFSTPQTPLASCEAVDYHSAKLTWPRSDSASGYYIYRSVKEDGTYRKIKTISKNTTLTYTDTGIVPGKKFFYKIATYIKNADGTVTSGELSAPMQVQTQMEAPLLSAVTANIDNRSLALAWNKVAGATGYRIYRSQDSEKGFTKIADLTSGTIVGYEDRSVTPGDSYFYRIKAVYANSKYTGLSLASSVLGGDVAAGAPIGLTITQTATDVLKISWQQSNGAASYNLYRSDGGTAKYTCIAENLADTSYTDTGLKDDQTYFYRVSAVGTAGEGKQCLPISYTVGGISMSTRTLKVCVNVSKPLEASTFRQGRIVWKSSNPKIAEVNSNGMVTGISLGTATITATVSGKSTSAVVSVTPGIKNGIDVSRWQEDVDWHRVKKSGIEFAFLRISNHYLEDYTFETKYMNASAAGIPIGVYCYSRAVTVAEAEEEARTVLSILNGRKLDYPIAFDLEDAVHKSATMTKENLHNMIHAFKNVIENAGYRFVLYSYTTFLNTNLDRTKLEGIDLWIARYRSLALGTGYTGTGNEKYWQYNSGQYSGSNSQVDGITDKDGNLVSVDVNIEY